jgi:D-alanyl-D-alanine dipeptidase
MLPAGIALLVLDGWRPLALQAELFEHYQELLTSLETSDSSITGELYVSKPSADFRHPSPHLTGGAVDVVLADAFGRALDMGAEFDEFDARAHIGFYESRNGEGSDDMLYALRRRELSHALSAAGFVNHAPEFWHFSYGDQMWGLARGRSARYGPAALPQALRTD